MAVTLSLYIGRVFAVWAVAIFLALTGIAMLFETVELLRRSAGKVDATLLIVLQMMLLKAPFMAQKLTIFAVLFGAMATFWRLTRSQELIVARATGVSAWQFLFPAILLAFVGGIATVTVLNPIAATLLARFEVLEARSLKGSKNTLAVSESGLWLLQAEAGGHSMIHAARVRPGEGAELEEMIIFLFDSDWRFASRLDAASGVLAAGQWELQKVWRTGRGLEPTFAEVVKVPTSLTIDRIKESFASPETMSFWDLPAFVRLIEQSGFSGHRHKLQFHRLLATPFMLGAMVLIAAIFSLRQQRRGGTMGLIASGGLLGFLIYFMSDLVFALGLSNSIPVVMAAWIPAAVSTMLGAALVFHMEDG